MDYFGGKSADHDHFGAHGVMHSHFGGRHIHRPRHTLIHAPEQRGYVPQTNGTTGQGFPHQNADIKMIGPQGGAPYMQIYGGVHVEPEHHKPHPIEKGYVR